MSHGQPKRPQAEDSFHCEPIKYGDVFKVTGELASKPISPQEAAAMKAAEAGVLGQPQKGSPAVVMQAAAAINQACGAVDGNGVAIKKEDVSVTETTTAGNRIITESVGGQVLGKRVDTHAPVVPTDLGSAVIDGDPITIGEALEAVAIAVGDKPVNQNDAAAISAAEIRATGEKNVRAGGVGASAQSAATLNSHVMRVQDMTKLSDILTDATDKLAMDKAVTQEDAEAVYTAEMRFPWRGDATDVISEPGGVAASMATAAKLNEEK
ncbi:hypothetical protein VNO77_26898 [Canavalia gladiata]|uniref:SMP domain-containing protein n=1 Tax=Canavalia gladiata TaxID=3824 RepID=A0AAN9KUU8_CANGL